MSEAFYDREIAPVLLELARKCEAAEVPFLAVVEYAPGDFGQTQVRVGASDTMSLTYIAARTHGNIDALAFAWAKQMRQSGRGHGSIVLKHLGVPLEPTAEAER